MNIKKLKACLYILTLLTLMMILTGCSTSKPTSDDNSTISLTPVPSQSISPTASPTSNQAATPTVTPAPSIDLSSDSEDSSNDLAMFQGNIQHTGFYTLKGPEEFHGLKWKFSTNDKINSSPIAYDNIIYFGSNDGFLYAVDSEAGTEVWKFQTEGQIKSSPAVNQTGVYFLCTDGYFYALDTKKGDLIWKYKTDGEYVMKHTVDYWQSSPALDKGILYFAGEDSTVYALNAGDGTVIWKQKLPAYDVSDYQALVDTGKEYNPAIHTSPVILDDMVYFSTGYLEMSAKVVNIGNLVALSIKDGKISWTSELITGCLDASPMIANDKIYCGTSNAGLYCFDAKSGEITWHSLVTPFDLGTFSIINNTLLSGSSDFNTLYALDAGTGEKIWEHKVIGPIHASVINDGATVYCACGNHYTDANQGIIYAVDIQTGAEKWEYQTGGNIVSSPTIYNGILYIGNDDGCLYAIY